MRSIDTAASGSVDAAEEQYTLLHTYARALRGQAKGGVTWTINV